MAESVPVNVDNFARVETDRMFAGIATMAGGVNRWNHFREPTPIDEQTVIRMNRDTLYSAVIVDISEGATLVVPDAGDRYLTVMVVDEDHYIARVFDRPGTYPITVDEFGTPYVLLAARTLVDASDPADVAVVNTLQDQLSVTAASSTPFVPIDFDEPSRAATFDALVALSRGVDGTARMFGRRDEVDPVRHLIGTAFAWGGLPEHQAYYLNVEPQLPAGSYEIRVGDVRVDAFWSITVYNAEGYFEANELGAYNVNSVMAARNDDGTITVRLGPADDPRAQQPNFLPIVEGWNYLVRLYQPRPEAIDGTWQFPEVTAVGA